MKKLLHCLLFIFLILLSGKFQANADLEALNSKLVKIHVKDLEEELNRGNWKFYKTWLTKDAEIVTEFVNQYGVTISLDQTVYEYLKKVGKPNKAVRGRRFSIQNIKTKVAGDRKSAAVRYEVLESFRMNGQQNMVLLACLAKVELAGGMIRTSYLHLRELKDEE